MKTTAQDLFVRALEMAADERDAFLHEACGDDAELRLEVQRLLVDSARADARFGDMDGETLVGAPGAGDLSVGSEKEGDLIGPYKLCQPLGEGGFGIVWMAEQREPISRMVALKIVKAGMDTKQVMARFAQEQQALAMMDHPNIAKVFDAGATDQGRPYFVMELVRGIPITTYCDQHNLPTAERLRLFVAVCHALQHAHQKGIIHRDIKPTNILVTLDEGGAVPKVIDFGVAKATQQRLTELTVFTQFEQMIGTPLYMSPEQAEMSGLDVDTRSDIYSLGVVLYELLTGRTPFDREELMRRGYDEIRKMIREQEPPKPSTAFSTMARDAATDVAQHRQSEPPKLAGLIRGDLDWIVMKALEKDRSRRYETANALAMDVERHLAGEPILARPPTAFYRLDRLLRRNKLAFAAAAGVMLALAAGAGFSLWQARQAERDSAVAKAALLDLQMTAPAFAEQARAMAAREDFDGALEKLGTAAALRPDVAEYRVRRGDLFQCQLRFPEAVAEYRAALAIEPGNPRAKANAALCDRLRAANADPTKLAPESLRELADAMEREHRPAVQRLVVARRLGEEKKVLLAYWIERLSDLPLPPEKPLAERLTLRTDGLLALDLQGTRLNDLSSLEGVPLGEINATGCTKIKDLQPLTTLPLTVLKLAKSGVTDLAPLSGMRTLKQLDLNNTAVSDLSPLASLPLRHLDAANIPASDFSPLAGCPLETCMLGGTKVKDLAFLKNAPLRTLDLSDCSDARNFASIAGCKTLETIKLPVTALDLPVPDLDAIGTLRELPMLKTVLAVHAGAGEMAPVAKTPGSLGVVISGLSVVVAQQLGLPDSLGTMVDLVQSGSAAEKAKLHYRDVIRTFNGKPVIDRDNFLSRLSQAGANADVALGVWRKGAMLTLHATLDAGRIWFTQDPAAIAATSTSEFWKKWDLLITVARPLRAAGIEFAARVRADGTLELSILDQPITDLAILHGAPISHLRVWNTKVSDLRPLAGMKLITFLIAGSPVVDLSPLRGQPITCLGMTGITVKDLSPLEGMPLATLYAWRCRELSDYSPLANLQTLREIQLGPIDAEAPRMEIEALRKLPNLENISFSQLADRGPASTAKEFWKHWDGLPWLEPLQAGKYKFIAQQLKDGRWSLTVNDKGFSDCSIFKGAQIEMLDLRDSGVSDLTPLHDLPLTYLNIARTAVTDISPLHGMQLESLGMRFAKVTDISPLRGMPLTWLVMEGLDVADITPLAGMKLELLVFNSTTKDISVVRDMPLRKFFMNGGSPDTDLEPLAHIPSLVEVMIPKGKNIEALRNLPNVKRLGYSYDLITGRVDTSAKEFWTAYDSTK